MKSKISEVLTQHARNRIGKRFGVQDRSQIKRVLNQAVRKGRISKNGHDTLIEHGCLLIAGNSNGNGSLVVKTVYDLSDEISKKLKKQMENQESTPWQECEVVLKEERGLEA